jgi:hypothetical protein
MQRCSNKEEERQGKGEKRRGKDRIGKERKGKERKGKERKGKERKGKEMTYSCLLTIRHEIERITVLGPHSFIEEITGRWISRCIRHIPTNHTQ